MIGNKGFSTQPRWRSLILLIIKVIIRGELIVALFGLAILIFIVILEFPLGMFAGNVARLVYIKFDVLRYINAQIRVRFDVDGE